MCPVSDFNVGDRVEVLDEGLAMLRRLCPDQPPNHHGRVSEIDGDTIFVEFPIDGGYEHSQCSPYPVSKVRRLA
jgi:alkanesulfonate monooxygenase SsuD/methylene tetrahydromethanopterin reductase-like flavin-dependent oxidoreductase (luciferase family)